MAFEKQFNKFPQFLSHYRHLLLFGITGLLLLTGGVVGGLWVADVFFQRRTLLVGSAMLSVLLSIIGALALFTGTMLYSVRRLLEDMADPEKEGEEQEDHAPSARPRDIQFVIGRPLLFFGGPGTTLLGAGVALGIRVVAIMRQTRELAIGSALVCMLLSIVGCLGILAGIILHSLQDLLRNLAQARSRR